MIRKLAHIERIDEAMPIAGKDRIQLVKVLSWQIIAGKEFHVGDLVVLVEPDSILPEKPEFEFMRSKKFRVKAMKMAGVISQAILFPLSILPPGKYNISDDVTKVLGVTKYEEPEPFTQSVTKPVPFWKQVVRKLPVIGRYFQTSKQRAGWPDFVAKTDEERVQNMPFVFTGNREGYSITEKLDGSSATYVLRKYKKFGIFPRYEFIVCSRNLRQTNQDSTWWKVAKKYYIEDVLHQLIGDEDYVVLQGEIIGPAIQGNKYSRSDLEFYAFNLIYPTHKVNSSYAKLQLGTYKIMSCPILYNNYTLPDTVDELLKFADGESALHNTLREGLVLRKNDISFKAISPEFMVKHGV